MSANVLKNEKKSKSIEALVAGQSQQEAASLAGISERQLRRWLTEGDFQQALFAAKAEAKTLKAQLRERLIEKIADDFTSDVADARSTLKILLNSPDDMVRLRAARAIFDNFLKIEELSEFRTRLETLEQASLIDHEK